MANSTETRDTTRKAAGSTRLRVIEFGVAVISGIVVVLAASIVHESISSFRLTVVMATVAWVLAAHAGAFKVAISMEDRQVVPTVAVATLFGFVSTATVELLFLQSVHSFAQYLMSSLVTFAALASGVLLARQIIRSIWLNGNLRTTAVVVGNEFTTHELAIEMREHQELGIDVVGEVGTANDGSLARLVAETRPDRVIIAGESTYGDIELAATVSESSARVYIMPSLLVTKTRSACFTKCQVNGAPLMRVDRKSRPLYERVIAPSRDLVSGI